MAVADRYARKWHVPGSEGRIYTVSVTHDGQWQCSCPVWKFRRQECKHIMDVRGGGYNARPLSRPTVVLANVCTPTLDKPKNELLVPLVTLDRRGNEMEITICNALLDNGYSMAEVRDIRRIPKSWTADAIREHVKKHGQAVYPAAMCKPENYLTDKKGEEDNG